MEVTTRLEESFSCTLWLSETKVNVFRLPEVLEKKYKLRECDAKEVADEINSFFAQKDPEIVFPVIKEKELFCEELVLNREYLMMDDSVLVWIKEWDSWGFIYPKEYVFFGCKVE